MVKNPRDLLTKLTKTDMSQIKNAESLIDEILELASLSELSEGVYIDASLIPVGEKVSAKIKDMYRNAGWTVSYFSDQRDGDAWVFKINKRFREDSDPLRPDYLR